MTMEPKAIFLDWDGTICNSRFWGHWPDSDAYSIAYTLIQDHLFKANPETLNDWMRGSQNAEDVMVALSHNVGLVPEELLAHLRESCERMQFVDEKILPLIEGIRRMGTKVVMATDNMDTFTRWTVPALRLDQHFDDILDSHSLKALKRDKDHNGRSAFFAGFLTDNDIDPATTVLIDDGLHNAVVRNFGMGFIHVTPTFPITAILSSLKTRAV
jgi:FMN phosphatase YigB (HAD superfamily)